MRTPHKLALIIAVLTFPSLLPDVCAQSPTPTPCATPPAQGQSTTWKQGATVNVMIDPTFTPEQQQAIKDQLNKWKNAGGANITCGKILITMASPNSQNLRLCRSLDSRR